MSASEQNASSVTTKVKSEPLGPPQRDLRLDQARGILADRFTPPTVLVDRRGHVVYFIGDCGRFLTPPAGAPDLSVVAMALPQLRRTLRASIRTAAADRRGITRTCRNVATAHGPVTVELIVEPMPDANRHGPLLLVSFIERDTDPAEAVATTAREDVGCVSGDVHNLLASTQVALIILDRDLRIRRYGPAQSDVFELTTDDIGKRVGAAGLLFEYPDLEAEVARVLRDLVSVEREVRGRGDGWFLMRMRPYRNTDDVIDGVLITFIDVTRLHYWETLHTGQASVLEALAMDRPLREVLSRVVAVIEAADSRMLTSILVVDYDGNSLSCGAAPGLPEEFAMNVEGTAIGPMAGPCGAAAYRRQRVVIESITDDPICVEQRAMLTSYGIVACSSEPIFSPEGVVLGTLCFLFREPHRPEERDERLSQWAARLAGLIIERKRSGEALEARVEHRTAELERVQRAARQHQAELAHVSRISAVGEMASGLAHELNQPLSAIMNFAEAAAGSEETLPLSVRRDLTRIVEQANRAATIVRRLRSFVRKGDSVRVVATIGAEIVEQVMPFVEAEAHRHGVVVHVDGTDLPLRVAVNITEIQQVILNLARNGIEAMTAMEAGERRLDIEVSAVEPDHVEVAVRDTGPGIGSDVADRVFDPFYTSKRDGMGLGLSIARTIVEEHDGRLWAVCDQGTGVTFRFALPLWHQGATDGQ